MGVLASLAIFLLLAILFSFPPLRATAQRFARFFILAESDRAAVEVPTEAILTPVEAFPLTITESETLADFEVKTPTELPAGIFLNGASYSEELNTIVLDYTIEASNQILRISQRQVDKGENYARIGIDAEVDLVQFGDTTAEYVVGGWRLPELSTLLESTGPGVSETFVAQWDPEANVQILRWQAEGVFFEILYVGGEKTNPADLQKEDLIKIAKAMN